QGSATNSHSSIIGHTASTAGGGVAVPVGGEPTILHSTISGNLGQSASGAGLYAASGGPLVELVNVTLTGIASNSGSADAAGGVSLQQGAVLTLKNSILAGNTTQGVARNCAITASNGTVTSLGHNIIGPSHTSGGGTNCPRST